VWVLSHCSELIDVILEKLIILNSHGKIEEKIEEGKSMLNVVDLKELFSQSCYYPSILVKWHLALRRADGARIIQENPSMPWESLKHKFKPNSVAHIEKSRCIVTEICNNQWPGQVLPSLL
jgi:hypothetical protein